MGIENLFASADPDPYAEDVYVRYGDDALLDYETMITYGVEPVVAAAVCEAVEEHDLYEDGRRVVAAACQLPVIDFNHKYTPTMG